MKGDLRTIPFNDDTFVGVWMCASLLHIRRQDTPRALSDARRVLRAGGLLYVAVKEGAGEDLNPEGRFYAYWDLAGIYAALSDAGFDIEDSYPTQTGDVRWLNVFAR